MVKDERAKNGVTAFQGRVYEATRQIPRGTVMTYGELARLLGCRSARAVGQALRRNPFAPEVPCHRVVASDGSLGGFYGRRTPEALARKRALLEAEGVVFDGEKVRLPPSKVFENTGKLQARWVTSLKIF